MRNTEDIDRVNREILKVTERLEGLATTLQNLVIERQNKEPEERTEKCNGIITNNFKKGDRVQVTNMYKGKKGILGEVTNNRKYFTYFKDNENNIHKRVYHNLKRVKKIRILLSK